jgi:3-hydroxyacyl-CoA dehydrogenase/3a,7a,12a-trihydroxy-5b-cholest-24-enoyl-CoA hydratase
MALRFDGKVVVVTGAGAGLGKEYALEFAGRGAKVVVNDLGGSGTGQGSSSKAADIVVEEIKAKGGEAVANYNSVEDGEKIIETAINAFGKVDILINNAGILRDVSFAKMTDQDWDLITAVHLRGAYKCTKAAWPHMLKNKFGRIITVTSAAGIYGNFGQVNYSMAKSGLLGFTKSLALEGSKKNIFSNSIAPLAASRLTETVLPKEALAKISPKSVVPLAVLMCHEDSTINGEVIEAGGGWFQKVRVERSHGADLGADCTPEKLKDAWGTVVDFSKDTQHPTTMGEHPAFVVMSSKL